MIRIGIINVSDRASQGIYEDLPGKAIVQTLNEYLLSPWEKEYAIIPDEQVLIVPDHLGGCLKRCWCRAAVPECEDGSADSVGPGSLSEIPVHGDRVDPPLGRVGSAALGETRTDKKARENG